MTEEQRRKLSKLKAENRKYREQLGWKSNVLLQECLEALEEYRIVNDEAQIARILSVVNGVDIIQISHSAAQFLSVVTNIMWFGIMVMF